MREYIVQLPFDSSVINYFTRICDGDECVSDNIDFKQSSVDALSYRIYCAQMFLLSLMNDMYNKLAKYYETQGDVLDPYYRIFTVEVESISGDTNLSEVEVVPKTGVTSVIVPYKYYFRITTTIDVDEEIIQDVQDKINEYVTGPLGSYAILPSSVNKRSIIEKIIIFNYHLSQPYVDEGDTIMTDGYQADRRTSIYPSRVKRNLINFKIIDGMMYVDLSTVINYGEIHNYLQDQ